jgi:hypothetical protein
MHQFVQLARPLARLSRTATASSFRNLATQTSTPSKRFTGPAPSKPSARKTTPKNYPDSPVLPTITGHLPPPSKTAEEILAAGTPYLVRRTPYAQLPVYRRWRGGGTLEEVIVKKIDGDRKKLAMELTEVLGCDPTHVKINPTTMHVEVKVCSSALARSRTPQLLTLAQGDHYERTRSWLLSLGF